LPPRLEGEEVTQSSARVEARFGVGLKVVEPEQLPPVDPEPWVAVIATSDPEVNHVVAFVGRTVLGRDRLHFPRAFDGLICGLLVRTA
jgi:hypothetical protein